MTSKDLMIGDWVYDTILQGYTKVEILTLTGIRGSINDAIWHEKTFEPIPLTAEILEKNFPEPTDGLTWFPEEGGFNCHTYVPKCEINAFGLFKYVHELQNALRLCGIDKDIEL